MLSVQARPNAHEVVFLGVRGEVTYMQLFAFPEFLPLARRLVADFPDVGLHEARVERYANHELHVALPMSVRNKACLLLGSIAPPEEHLVEFLLYAHTLRHAGASEVTAHLPYLSYSRHDKDEPRHSLGIQWIGEMAKASGVHAISTIELHSKHDAMLCSVPISSTSAAHTFAEIIRESGWQDASIIAPDEGAVARCERVRDLLHSPLSVIHCVKERTKEGVRHLAIKGEPKRRAVIVDDMLDTGETLLSACRKLMEAGVAEIMVMVAHGLFTGVHWHELRHFCNRIICLDTLPREQWPDGIEVLSAYPLIHEATAKWRTRATLLTEREAVSR